MFTYSKLTAAYIPQAAALLDDAMGVGYVTPAKLAKLDATCVVDQHDNVVGVCIADIVTDSSGIRTFLRDAGPRDADLISALLQFPVGLIHTIAVRPDLRRRGIGTRLTEMFEEVWRDSGVKSMLSLGWRRADTGEVPISGVLKARGLRTVAEIDDFWTQDSVRRGYSCPADGSPCHCKAVVFVGSLKLEGHNLGVE